MKIVNTTPLAIVLENSGAIKTYEPSGFISRVCFKTNHTDVNYDGFPVVANVLEEIVLPEQVADTTYVVSAMVLAEAKKMGRTDCVAPDTNNARRNDKGHIVSVPGFIM